MNRLIGILLISLAIAYNKSAFSQEQIILNPSKKLSQYPIKTWDMDKGMPSDMVIQILEDTTGYIWLATYKGIARFDGVNFTNFNHSSSSAIESVTIQAATIDSDKNLWFGSQKGLVKYVNYQFVRDPRLSSLNNTSIEALYYDSRSSTLWIGTTSNGVYRYRNRILEHLPQFLKIAKGIVKAIGCDLDGNIWIGTEGGKVTKFNGESFSEIQSDERMGGIGRFYCNSQSHFWVAAESGIFKLHNNRLILQNQIPIQKATSLIEDNYGRLWIGSENGLYRYHIDTGKLEHKDESKGLPNNLIKDIHVDRYGNIWVATYRKGIFKLTDGLITTFSQSEGLSSDIVIALAQFEENKFYVADEYGTINILENGSISKLKLKSKISKDRLKNLYFDSKSNLWISTYGGLIKLDSKGAETILNLKTGFPTETIRMVFEDKEGNIWIGTRSNGLFLLGVEGELKEYSIGKGLSSNYIMAINQDNLGRIIVSTKNGINIIRDGTLEKVIGIENGLPTDFAFNIHIDSDNVFWVATNDGLIRIENDNSYFVFDIQNGLFDNTLFDILEDDFGYFWMPTDMGIVRMNKAELNSFAIGETDRYSYRIFGRSDGMKNPRCTGATKSLKARDGKLFFTTAGGVSIVNPKEVDDLDLFSRVLVENLELDGELVLLSEVFKVKPSVNRVVVNYTAFHSKDPEKVYFRYQLYPFDQQWIYAEQYRYAPYTNLPPGNYTFSVQTSFNQTDWSEGIAQNIIVARKWNQTWWFRILLSFILSLILWIIFRVRTYTVKMQKIELERIVQERTAMIEEQKLKLETQSKELEKLSIVASHTNNAIMIMSPEGDIQWVNESFSRIYGYTVEQFVEEMGKNLIWVSKNPNIQYVIQKCIDEKEPTNYVVQVKTKSGAPLWIQTNLTPIKDDNGKVLAIVAIDSDITELKQVESEMIAMNDEIMKQAEAIMKQKVEIEAQRDELEQVNNLLFKHNQNIESSIWYAQTIQKAILPLKKSIDQFFENFIVFKPKDIVSGDFYWFNRLTDENDSVQKFVLAVVDCTGHGVPGALMSMVGSRLLSEIIIERNIHNPAEILSQLNKQVNIVLKQETVDNIDGMDIVLCYIEMSSNELKVTFAGANRPLYYVKKGFHRVEVIKGSRKSIGGIMPDLDAEFQNYSINFEKGDTIFLCTDGYADQNRPDGKKLTVCRFHEMLLSKINASMLEIGEFLDISFDEFRATQQQRDDATVLGIRF